MNQLVLKPVMTDEDKSTFIVEVQTAFQNAYVNEFGTYDKTILPTEDVEDSFNADGSEAYFAEVNGKRVGGAVIVTEKETGFGSLHLLYVRIGSQNAGYGLKIWKVIEKLHPEIILWETHTPYFDKRNIHFYVNRCGFKIVEFFNPKHQDPHQTGDGTGNIPEENDYFFRFEKDMRQN